MGNMLKILGAMEMLAAIVWVIMISNRGQRMGGCQGIEDILARMDCEEIANGMMAGLSASAVYILVGGAVGAVVLYALGHIVTMVEEIHKRTCEK